MSSRKLSADELKLHQAALNANDKILSVKEAGKLVPDAAARTAAINFLLGTGMFKVMASAGGVTAFRAVAKNEMEIKKDMTPEESMVLSRIQASGNEGIWTKHLKAKTELHQTVIDRCLKSLVQKQLVKSIKAVRHPTRKIYMLAHLEPSVELTGGPWYTDNELDAEFIKLLSSACLHYIRDRSFPKQNSKHLAQNQIRLYVIGAAPSYPSAQQIQHFLSKSKITVTELEVEHVEMLLRVLELDGEIEKIPAFSASTWNPPSNSDETGPDSESDPSDDERSRLKKRKRGSSKIKESSKLKRRKKKQDSDSESDSELEDRSKAKKRKKRSKRDEDSDEECAKSPRKRKRKSKRGDSSSEDESEEDRKKKHRRKSKKRQDIPSDEESESSEDDEDGKSASRPKSLSKSKKSSSKNSSTVKRHKSPAPDLRDEFSSGAFVYRAIRQECAVLGWSQAPCGRCPVFDFCRDKGPTNPRECVYYEDWLASRTHSQKDTATSSVKVEV
ncbi:RNA polymerase Rpc34 subunit-domain-containing protein [Pisolithus marmoratus]|nr:RNA polymerase Rpc34 subunit-domain-containing protein [Pisolithus marmoratus]